MTPAEIEAEAARLFAAWAAVMSPRTWAWGALDAGQRRAWLAVAEASLRARDDMREMIARLQWGADANPSGEACCPMCGATRDGDLGQVFAGRGAHEDACLLAELLPKEAA